MASLDSKVCSKGTGKVPSSLENDCFAVYREINYFLTSLNTASEYMERISKEKYDLLPSEKDTFERVAQSFPNVKLTPRMFLFDQLIVNWQTLQKTYNQQIEYLVQLKKADPTSVLQKAEADAEKALKQATDILIEITKFLKKTPELRDDIYFQAVLRVAISRWPDHRF